MVKPSKLSLLSLAFCFVLILFSQINLFAIKDLSIAKENVIISRVIDGDTFQLQDGRTIRLANINSPEKNSPLSVRSFNFLRQFENKTVSIQVLTTDKYGRQVARVYEEYYINQKIVELGLASKFLVQEDEDKLFFDIEDKAIRSQQGIWNHSRYYGCFKLKVEPKLEFVSITNLCSISLKGFSIKDESRKIYKFQDINETVVRLYSENGQNTKDVLFWNSQTHIWNDDKDTAYLFDNENHIAAYSSYGY
ncbi:MAG TPA: thermonuclease family protein [Candidatus Nanoarchaeia archaeon]|nr:thermonuclease family protein [Candidatus Nanoarchaeia archaeon]